MTGTGAGPMAHCRTRPRPCRNAGRLCACAAFADLLECRVWQKIPPRKFRGKFGGFSFLAVTQGREHTRPTQGQSAVCSCGLSSACATERAQGTSSPWLLGAAPAARRRSGRRAPAARSGAAAARSAAPPGSTAEGGTPRRGRALRAAAEALGAKSGTLPFTNSCPS